jgi:probable HAF family extracellular repeat protein
LSGDTPPSIAFLWDDVNGMRNLNNLIDPASGWVLKVAFSINDQGQIVGMGTNPAGQKRGFLLTPP